MSNIDNIPENYYGMDFTEFVGLLPCGYYDLENESVCRIVDFRPQGIIGEDEHELASQKNNANGAKAITAFLSHGLVSSIQGVRKVTPDMIRSLSTGDRDYLLMRASEVTFGADRDLRFEHQCQFCRSNNEVQFNIDKDIEVSYLQDNCERDKKGSPIFHCTLPVGIPHNGEIQREVTYRLVTGFDSERLAPISKVNPAQANTALMSMIILKIGEIERIDDKLIAKLSTRDRQFFNAELLKNAPGPKFTLDVTCAGCGKDLKVAIPTNVFLSD